MIGQNSHSLLCLSIIMQVLQSGNSGLSASVNGSLQVLAPLGSRAPSTATSSAERSPEPRYQETSNSPSRHSTIPGA